jgi:transposase InsO family protein
MILKSVNTDQGSQFTSEEWLAPLKAGGVAISMDGKGRWIDNLFIERLWRSVKYEEVNLRACANGHEAQSSLCHPFAQFSIMALDVENGRARTSMTSSAGFPRRHLRRLR